ncbi:MAG: YebC/PmpR family DNA-binding transcriptional regulator [Chloroflexi bacterium]|nr:YebC/PmpR family DNA-binding transcriptional regulator [Chloroflexota bacterium]
MSGHSKWAQIKRQKGVNDARRGQLFTKLGREITVAARDGGPDPDGNFRLRLAVQKARQHNMPMENVERAIKRGAGAGEGGVSFEEITYEGYGPGGVAIMVRTLTDNRNRTASEVRSVLTRSGGNLGETGSVSWIFDPRGQITVALGQRDPDEAMLEAIDLGADDVVREGDELIIYTEASALNQVRHDLESHDYQIIEAEQTMLSKTQVELEEHQAEQVLKLLDRLEELEDVQQLYSNYSIPDEIMERIAV